MSESVPVRCPACLREHLYRAPAYPCVCGTPVAPALDPDTPPSVVVHPVWEENWITVPCPGCGRRAQWPRPELGCPCGTVLRIPVDGPPRPAASRDTGGATPEGAADGPHGARTGDPGRGAGEHASGAGEQAFRAGEHASGAGTGERGSRAEDGGRGVTAGADGGEDGARATDDGSVRTLRGAVTAVALFLHGLGHRDLRRAGERPPSGIGLAARGLVAHLEPSARQVSARDVECLWLSAMTESARCAHFSLAGYDEAARARAETLMVPLFVLDRSGPPRPVNSHAEELATADPWTGP